MYFRPLLLIVLMNLAKTFVFHLQRPSVTHLMVSRSVRTAQRNAVKLPKTTPVVKSAGSSVDTSNSSAQLSFESILKKLKQTDAHKKILQTISQFAEEGQLNQTRAFFAMKTMTTMRMQEDIPFVINLWLKDGTVDSTSEEFNCTVKMIRFCCIQKSMESVEKMTSRLGFIIDADPNKKTELALTSENFETYTRLLIDLSLGYVSMGMLDKSFACLRLMKQHSMVMENEVARKILKEFTAQSGTQHIRRCLRNLIELTRGLDDMESIQLLNNVFIRSIEFVTGAVSMATLPAPLGPEVAFIGRSNVGKSSLINTICNRKEVAYTSKKPGKTAEFNYFDARGVVGPHKEPHQFYLVDLPGVGYALKSRALRENWTNLLRDFVQNRPTLRVLFHLVDSRHGLMDSDEECLSLLEGLPPHVLYCVVLTKVDKQRGAEKVISVQEYVLDKIYSEIAKRTTRVVPILFTSSVNKMGVTSLWSTLLDGIHRTVPRQY